MKQFAWFWFLAVGLIFVNSFSISFIKIVLFKLWVSTEVDSNNHIFLKNYIISVFKFICIEFIFIFSALVTPCHFSFFTFVFSSFIYLKLASGLLIFQETRILFNLLFFYSPNSVFIFIISSLVLPFGLFLLVFSPSYLI